MKRTPLGRKPVGRPPRGQERKPRVCPRCGNKFRAPTWRSKFCSYACANEDKKRPVVKTCPGCGQSFERLGGQIRRFCSPACAREAKAAKPRPVRVCVECGESFTVPTPSRTSSTGFFCSRRCMGVARRRPVIVACASCGRDVARTPATVKTRRSFCNRQCQADARYKGTGHSRGRGWKKLAESIRERDGRECVRCGTSEDPAHRLAVDHIFPWSDLRDDPERANDPDNLASLCLSCHGFKSTYVEIRMARGDFVALLRFYGEDRIEMARVATNRKDSQ